MIQVKPKKPVKNMLFDPSALKSSNLFKKLAVPKSESENSDDEVKKEEPKRAEEPKLPIPKLEEPKIHKVEEPKPAKLFVLKPIQKQDLERKQPKFIETLF